MRSSAVLNSLWARVAVPIATIWRTLPASLNRAAWRSFHYSWPLIWRALALLNRCVPREGRLRNAFKYFVFTRYWDRYYKSAYTPEWRDRYFEWILTFFYDYPVRKGDIVVQIGASFGEETRRFARAVGPSGRVIAIEPEPGNVRALTANVGHFPQVTIVPVGAWCEKGTMAFFVGGPKEHRLRDIPGEKLTFQFWGVKDHLDPSRYKECSVVPVDTVPNILKQVGVARVAFVLVETNGSELEVVQGMSSRLDDIKHMGARGHVERDGMPIHEAISLHLRDHGFQTTLTSEGMVLARSRAA